MKQFFRFGLSVRLDEYADSGSDQMSYSIQYGPKEPPLQRKRQHVRVSWLMAAVLIPTLILAVGTRYTNAKGATEAILPWEQEYVREAFSDFTDSVRSGGSFKEAVTTLCTQILEGEESAK